MVKRLTTWVMEIRPTFWLKEVMGEQPNTPPERAEAKPSTHREPEISSTVMSRPRPPVQQAVVSPMVSTAETMNTRQKDRMAPSWNWGLKANSWGTATMPSSRMVLPIPAKSTMPKKMDTT